LGNFGAIWNSAMPSEQRTILRHLLDAVYLDAERGPVTAIKPKPHLAALFQTPHTGATGVKATPGVIILQPGQQLPKV